MAGISSLGIGSGLDLNGLVSSIVQAERAPAQNRIDRDELSAKTELSAIGSLKATASGLASAVKALQDFSTPLKATTSGSESATAKLTSSKDADAGSYQVRVTQLASAQSLATVAFEDADASLGEGTFTLRVGDSEVEIALGGEVDSLRGLRDAINDSDVDVQAAVVRDGDSWRLLLTSGQTGAAGEMTAEVAGSVDGNLTSAAMQVTAEAQDAQFSVNGLELTSTSNKIDEVIPGVTLTLEKITEEGDSTTVTVGQDLAQVRTRLKALVSAYNGVRTTMKSVGSYNAEAGTGGPLLGDSMLRGLQSRINGIFTAPQATELEGNPFGSLSDLGFSVSVDGTASLDEAKLDAALAENQAGVEEVVSAFAGTVGETLGTFTKTDGIFDDRTDSLNARVKRLTDQRESLDLRMAQVEERYRAQFTALDAMVAQFQNTSSFLSSQLASISNISID